MEQIPKNKLIMPARLTSKGVQDAGSHSHSIKVTNKSSHSNQQKQSQSYPTQSKSNNDHRPSNVRRFSQEELRQAREQEADDRRHKHNDQSTHHRSSQHKQRYDEHRDSKRNDKRKEKEKQDKQSRSTVVSTFRPAMSRDELVDLQVQEQSKEMLKLLEIEKNKQQKEEERKREEARAIERQKEKEAHEKHAPTFTVTSTPRTLPPTVLDKGKEKDIPVDEEPLFGGLTDKSNTKVAEFVNALLKTTSNTRESAISQEEWDALNASLPNRDAFEQDFEDNNQALESEESIREDNLDSEKSEAEGENVDDGEYNEDNVDKYNNQNNNKNKQFHSDVRVVFGDKGNLKPNITGSSRMAFMLRETHASTLSMLASFMNVEFMDFQNQVIRNTSSLAQQEMMTSEYAAAFRTQMFTVMATLSKIKYQLAMASKRPDANLGNMDQ